MYTGEFYATHWDWGSHIVNLRKPKPHQRFITFLKSTNWLPENA